MAEMITQSDVVAANVAAALPDSQLRTAWLEAEFGTQEEAACWAEITKRCLDGTWTGGR